jgi:4-amino-4-deoxy-L-arabinose transferase-like glycosyltransferase
MGAYLLARRWIRSPLAALMAGWIYAFSPYRIGRYIIEQIDILSTAWIPLFVLFLLAFLDQPRWRRALAAAVCLFFQLLSSWYNGAYCLVFLAFAFLYYWLEGRLPWNQRKLWWGLALLVGIPAILLSPLILPMLHELQSHLF